jgi:CheY-like chemotaxis protein
MGDVTRIRQVIVNLVSNAVKFTAVGEVILGAFAHDLGDGQVEVQLSIRDTGIGIPPDKLEDLFLPFTQVDASTTRQYGGTGLGLTISRRLTDMMGGRIWAESSPGQGTTFFVSLRFDVADPPENYQTLPNDLFAGMHIAVVEQNAALRNILCNQLRAWGAEAHDLASGAETQLWLSGGPDCDLLLCDASLEDTTGVELLQALADRGHEQPMLLLASVAARVHDERLRGQIYKPIKRSLLARSVQNALDGTPTAKLDPETPAAIVSTVLPELTSSSTARILLAEDNEVNRRVASRMLAKLGQEVELAMDGQGALDAVRARDFDLVLMDVQMPNLDGLEATRRIREEIAPERQPSIVAMTANAMSGDRERCLEAGMNGYLSKPISFMELKRALEEYGILAQPVG